MPSALLTLGAYAETINPSIEPPIGIVGGDGSVDDRSDSTYVVIRAQRGNLSNQVRKTSYTWAPAALDLPTYSAVRDPRVDIRVRTQLTQVYPGLAPPSSALQVYQDGPLAGFFGINYLADDGDPEWRSGTYALTEARWTEFQAGTIEIGAFNTRASIFTGSRGDEERIAVIEIEYTIVWTLASPPPLRRYPVDNSATGPTRHYPPPKSRRAAGGYR